jgi:SH3-like domain-containing protein
LLEGAFVLRTLSFAVFMLVIGAGYVHAATERTYMSIRSTKVNMRVGPGNIYPIIWVYVVRGTPLEVIGKNNEWLQVQDKDGETGWVYHRMVSKVRTAMTISNDVLLHTHPDNNADVTARLMRHVVVLPLACRSSWCRISVPSGEEKIAGWVRRQYLWGMNPTELFEE